MSKPARAYIPVHKYSGLQVSGSASRPGCRSHSQEALYLGVQQGRVSHVRLGWRISVPSDVLDQVVTKPDPAADPLTSDAVCHAPTSANDGQVRRLSAADPYSGCAAMPASSSFLKLMCLVRLGKLESGRRSLEEAVSGNGKRVERNEK